MKPTSSLVSFAPLAWTLASGPPRSGRAAPHNSSGALRVLGGLGCGPLGGGSTTASPIAPPTACSCSANLQERYGAARGACQGWLLSNLLQLLEKRAARPRAQRPRLALPPVPHGPSWALAFGEQRPPSCRPCRGCPGRPHGHGIPDSAHPLTQALNFWTYRSAPVHLPI